MPRYVQLTLPRGSAESLRRELASIRSADLQMSEFDRAAMVRRLDAALVGKDLRRHNRHNTHRVKEAS